jgi:FkbM family methyltransferase
MKRPLDWGLIAQNKWFHQTCYTEVFIDDCYQKFFAVEPGDVVLDVGASVGPFSWSIADAGPAQVYCVEAHPELYKTLVTNLTDVGVPVTTINAGMGPQDGVNYLAGIFDPDKNTHTDGTDGHMMETISFQTLIKQHGITHIDFLKTAANSQHRNLVVNTGTNQRQTQSIALWVEWQLGSQKVLRVMRGMDVGR